MQAPQFPPDEARRLAALHRLNILDTPFEERFDRITRTAQRLFKVPFALISLIDAERQWFKSCQGLSATETPRDISFCGHAILDQDVFLVPNALNDPRFADNPLVTGGPQIRFYAGQPLCAADGSRIGTLCVIDTVPREMSESEQQALRDLAAWAEQELGMVELKYSAAATQNSAARLHAIVECMIDGVVTINEHGIVESFNPAAEMMFGYRAGEVVGQNINMLMPEPDKSSHDGYLRSFIETGKARIIGIGRLVYGRRKSGDIFPMELEVSAMRIDGLRMYTGIVRDISDRVRVENLLREQEKLLGDMIDNLTVPTFIIDTQHRVLRWNKACEEMTGVKSAELIGTDMHWKGFYDHPRPCLADLVINGAGEKGAEYYARYTKSKFLPQGVHAEGWYPNMGGKSRYIIFDAAPLYDQDNNLLAAIESLQDITEQKLAEQALAQTSSLQRAILDSASYSIISTDLNGLILSFNVAAEHMLGYAAAEVVGKVNLAIIHDLDEVMQRAPILSAELGRSIEPGFEVFVAKARALGVPDENEWTYVRKDGSRFPVLLSVTAIRDEAGRVTGYLGVAADITERKKVERMKSEFVSTVSHELRTPLTSIRGSLGLLLGGVGGEMTAQATSLLDVANKNCERLVLLINEILDIEKIESGNMQFDLHPQPLMPLLEQSIAANRDYGVQYGVTLQLVSSVADVKVCVDRDRFIQVMSNLLSNAVKYSPAHGQVEIAVTQQGAVRVTVTDQGSGIPADFHNKIFQKFSQADSSDTRPKGGTGLGLSITKAIVEKMGGQIGFDKQARVGASFYFEFPAC